MNIEDHYKVYKPLLFSIAYQIIGTVSDAEDIVHDSFITLSSIEETDVENIRAFMCRVVTNKSIDALRREKKQREIYTGPWLPEPLLGEESNPELLIERSYLLNYSFMLMLEILSPIERAAFILREAFDFDYKEIAAIIDKSEPNCRKIMSRAKEKLKSANKQKNAIRDEYRMKQLVERFLMAATQGKIDELISILHEEIVLYSDGGGKVLAALRPIKTKKNVISFIIGLVSQFNGKDTYTITPCIINGGYGIIITAEEEPTTTVCFDYDDDRISRIYMVRNPDKLMHLPM